MMILRAIPAMILIAWCSLSATTPHPSAPITDVFESFRLLDVQFTKLDTEFHELQETTRSDSRSYTKYAWRHAAREMDEATKQIRGSTFSMYSHYRGPQRRLGYRMFVLLHRRAQLLHTRLLPVIRAQRRAQARRDTLEVKNAMLDLVLQYQAISGGYAAAHCDAGAWSCGISKREPRKDGYPNVELKWICVPRTKACRGILGPRTPAVAPQSLTADTLSR